MLVTRPSSTKSFAWDYMSHTVSLANDVPFILALEALYLIWKTPLVGHLPTYLLELQLQT